MELASAAKGATVVVATSFDARHPPDVVLDGRDSTFFTTTGQFPQEMIIKLSESGAAIQSVQTITTNGEHRPFALVLAALHYATAVRHRGEPQSMQHEPIRHCASPSQITFLQNFRNLI
jgi:hypothetical protein